MEKEELIKKIDIFLNLAIQANCYNLIIKQFSEYKVKYIKQINISNAFYSYTFNALVVATVMELSKIYDSHSQSFNIHDLIIDCNENIEYFSDSLLENESATFEKINTSDDSVKENYFTPFKKQLENLEQQINNLKKQRNKIYAHNDKVSEKDLINKFSLYYTDIDLLINFALDFCTFAYSKLTNTRRSTAPLNINDWEKTLEIIKSSTTTEK
ncbi:hypothetical protein LJB88_03985 [Erysipelotrichaceae bacterium OttesenSCG-928-M19]|nr:hypothetical protein [Erysipelotrichaceae bacterium OttesenSCG-928-M19]